MGYQLQKVQKKMNSKNGVKTAHKPLFQELWAIFRKKQILMPILRQKMSAKIGYTSFFLVHKKKVNQKMGDIQPQKVQKKINS